MVKEIKRELLVHADHILKLSDREIMALSLGDNERWRDNYQMAMIIKNQKVNERLVGVTQILAGATIILSILTLLIQYIN